MLLVELRSPLPSPCSFRDTAEKSEGVTLLGLETGGVVEKALCTNLSAERSDSSFLETTMLQP